MKLKELLQLYNAVNHTNYSNPDDIYEKDLVGKRQSFRQQKNVSKKVFWKMF